MKFNQILTQFNKQKILIIGDALLDTYFKGTTERLCREAPVPIVSVGHREDAPGGAANAAVNIATLGAKAAFLSVVGEDNEGTILLKKLNENTVDTSHIVKDITRQTHAKNRVLAGTQLLVRYDYGSTGYIDEATENTIIDTLIELFPHYDGILISDYGYGLLTPKVLHTIKKLQEQFSKVIVVDSKYLDRYSRIGVSAVKPNYEEATKILHIPVIRDSKERLVQIEQHGQELLHITNAQIAAITLDVDGALIFENGKTPYRTYTEASDNAQAIGAGDTYISALTLALSAKASIPSAAEIAAASGIITVRKEGTTPCYLPELTDFFSEDTKQISTQMQLQERIKRFKEQGKRIVFTNGCFDILHRGHVTYLSSAKALGDVLIVGMNSDESIKRLKGPQRPINRLEDRMLVLSALSCVDYLVPFTDDKPLELIKTIKPDIYVKGGDYTKDTLPEAPLVEALGGKVEILSYIQDYSTTDIIRHIKSADQNNLNTVQIQSK